MAIKLKPIVRKIISFLEKQGFQIKRIKGSHVIINKTPSLKRPIVIPNKDKISNEVRQNLITQCQEIGINTSKLEDLF